MAPDRAGCRLTGNPGLAVLAGQLDRHLAHIQAEAKPSEVNRWRARVLEHCQKASDGTPGVFSLSVPTGGGKTLSSLAFALRHAVNHGLRRVIYAIPFTSIIEQNADVFRRALGPHSSAVLEHHSNLDPRRETTQSRLAAENWDAPLVVTTNVQVLESLFAFRSSRCRKLHRLVRSVIVLDEVQALPPNVLAPTLAALRELVTHYGCTIVLCTATQPALERREEFPIGLDAPRPIIPPTDRRALFDALRRVEVTQAGRVNDERLVDELASTPQVLCIVNTRAHAAALFERLTARLGETETRPHRNGRVARVGSCLHLSANMCPRHRSAVLTLIKRRMAQGLPCRVISTQLVEAGVDVDFPVVYRAPAGLDAIAQAAGRCNREGRMNELGKVVVFEPEDGRRAVPHFARQGVDDARETLAHYSDPLAPDAQHDYFARHYWKRGGDDQKGWDRPPDAERSAPGVLDCFRDGGNLLQFREAARRYCLIADDQQSVLIPYGRLGRRLVRQLTSRPVPPDRDLLRRLQRLAVAVRRQVADALLDSRTLLPPDQSHEQLVLGNEAAYDRRMGLRQDIAGLSPELLQV